MHYRKTIYHHVLFIVVVCIISGTRQQYRSSCAPSGTQQKNRVVVFPPLHMTNHRVVVCPHHSTREYHHVRCTCRSYKRRQLPLLVIVCYREAHGDKKIFAMCRGKHTRRAPPRAPHEIQVRMEWSPVNLHALP
jgi:hypothetical protein